MLVRLSGTLESIEQTSAIVACDGNERAYEVLLTSAVAGSLAPMQGQRITLHTIEFHEAQSQGGSFTPRIVGFPTIEDREFFRLFTTVKGVGTRKALKALALPTHAIASAIAGRDASALTALPEIGKRGAETIIAELHGKVDRFLSGGVPGGDAGAAGAGGAAHPDEALRAVDALVRLGESRVEARRLVDRVIEAKPDLAGADEILAAAVSLR